MAVMLGAKVLSEHNRVDGPRTAACLRKRLASGAVCISGRGEKMQETFRQWRERQIKQTMRRYGCSRKNAEHCQPHDSALREWVAAVELAADHNRLPDKVLASFARECGTEGFIRTFRGRLEQKGYILPRRFWLTS